ncbi:MAG: hypothetical protein M0R46_14810 [Candidatus Muirbacterium halophilum]|nr:hypothetical protein [Candidatus Muirbacterium halophilum]
MNICFVANHRKTIFFHKISQELEKKGIVVYWITVNKKNFNFLNKKYKKEKILYISKNIKKNNIVGEFKLNEIVANDRALKYNIKEGLLFLENIQKPVLNFLIKNNIKKIFGENTWAHEILIKRIAESENINYLLPHTIRIPYNRFGFFKDEYYSILLERKKHEEDYKNVDFLKKPDYLMLNDKKIKKNKTIFSNFKKIFRFLFDYYYDKFDPNYSGFYNKIKEKFAEKRNRLFYKYIKKTYIGEEFLKTNKYIFFGLHKQPEASIDVIGRYYEDQYKLIYNLWRILPSNYFLLIKDHTNAIGDRSYSFYKKIKTLPKVILLNEKMDSHLIVQYSQLVATVSGTIGFEAILRDKRAITFGPVFFSKYTNCLQIGLDDLKKYTLKDIIDKIDRIPNDIEKLKKYLICNSFEGIISDPDADERCIENKNIKFIVNSILYVCNNCESKY